MAAYTAVHLCSGYGGFELALRPLARIRTVCHVERDPYAAAVLVERMGEARLDQAPIWDDLQTFNGAAWRGRVDILTAGFPCQPFSSAGHRRGIDDDRWLWPDIARIIRGMEPRYVILENVPNVIRHGLPDVLHGLAALGFDAEWGCLSAAAVGAPHVRERFWLVAEVAHPVRVGRTQQSVSIENRETCVTGVALACEELADAEGIGRGWARLGPPAQEQPRRVADVYASSERVGFPPGRSDEGWDRWTTAGGPEPVLRRRSDGPPNGLADALHLGGNGLVPQCATEAIRQLVMRRISVKGAYDSDTPTVEAARASTPTSSTKGRQA